MSHDPTFCVLCLSGEHWSEHEAQDEPDATSEIWSDEEQALLDELDQAEALVERDNALRRARRRR